MVDAIVSFAVERLGDFLIQEAKFLLGVKDDVKWLKDELKMLQCCLKDAAEKEDSDNRVREWISQIRDVAYDIEDVIDTFILKVEVEGTQGPSKQGSMKSPARSGLLAPVKKCFCICNKGIQKEIDLYNLGGDIKALKAKVNEISGRRERYGIRNIGDVGEGTSGAREKLKQLRRTSPYADEEQVVGFEDVTSLLVKELLKTEPQRCVISILGMGGLGKTTLARKLFNHRQIKETFEHRAWVCVSQEYGIRDLFQRIIKSFKEVDKEELEMLEKMREEDLELYLHKLLNGHRYILVIDDVWDQEGWKILRKAFPKNSNGSRVIITTRIKAVAECSDEKTYLHELQYLKSYESWELFCRKVFPYRNATNDDQGRCPPELETLGREMVAKCRGLPLAIIVLGGLLSKKHSHEWHWVKEHIWRHLRNDSTYLSQILALSFNDLPYQLKPCFQYLGLFPEDFAIDVQNLIRLWVAEGFIPQRDEEALEEVAEDLLNDLIGRSLIQVAERWLGRPYRCRVHDLLRDLAINKAKKVNFLNIFDKNISSAPSSSASSSYRRQAVHCSFETYVSVDYSNSCLRTLLFFNQKESTGPRIVEELERLKMIFTRFKLLRVLNVQGVKGLGPMGIEVLGELIHLRYLGLRDTEIEVLPPSLVNLQALQTLVASSLYTKSVRLGSDISKLKQLRHLLGWFEEVAGIDQLENLQTLTSVDIYGWIKIDPVKLINLRELEIRAGGCKDSAGIRSNEQSREEEFSLDSIAYLRNLQSLWAVLEDGMYITSLQPLSHCQHLVELMINGRIKIPLPDEQFHEYLPHLKHLSLWNSGLREDPMPTLGKLPNLMILRLFFIDLNKLSCTAKGFPRLQVLELYRLERLEEFEVGEGAMPMLKDFRMQYCKKEVKVPERLKSILVPRDPSTVRPLFLLEIYNNYY